MTRYARFLSPGIKESIRRFSRRKMSRYVVVVVDVPFIPDSLTFPSVE